MNLQFLEKEEWNGQNGLIDDLYHIYLVNGLQHIGIGHLVLPNENFSEGLTKNEVYELFANDTNKRINELGSKLNNLTDNQKVAVLSWYYRTGALGSSFWNYLKNYADNKSEANKNALKKFWLEHYITAQNVTGNVLLQRAIREWDYFSSSIQTTGDSLISKLIDLLLTIFKI